MPVPLTLQVGPVNSAAGAQVTARAGNDAALVISEGHGKYYEQTYRAHAFWAYSTAAITAVAVSTTGLILINPNASGVNAVIQKYNYSMLVTTAAVTGIGFAFNIQTKPASGFTTATAATVVGGKLGAGGNVCQAYTSCNALDNAPVQFVSFPLTVAIATTGQPPSGFIDLDGSIIVPPGYALSLCATGAASGSNAIGSSLNWEEVPV
jgi:hypothetical protein